MRWRHRGKAGWNVSWRPPCATPAPSSPQPMNPDASWRPTFLASRILVDFRREPASEFGGRHARDLLEKTVERRLRVEAGLERELEDPSPRAFGVGESALHGLDAIGVHEVEKALAHTDVQHLAQHVGRDPHFVGQHGK